MPLFDETMDLLMARRVAFAFLTEEEQAILQAHYRISPRKEVAELLETLSVLGHIALQIMDGKPAAEIEEENGDTIGDREQMRRNLLVAYPVVELVRQEMDPLPSEAALASLQRRVLRYRRELQNAIGVARVDRIEEELKAADETDTGDETDNADDADDADNTSGE